MKLIELCFDKKQSFHFGIDDNISDAENDYKPRSKLNATKFVLSSDTLFSALCTGLKLSNQEHKIEVLKEKISNLSSVYFGIRINDNEKILFIKKPLCITFSKESLGRNRKITKKCKFASLEILKLWNKEGILDDKKIEFLDDDKFVISKEEFDKLKANSNLKTVNKLINKIKEQKCRILKEKEITEGKEKRTDPYLVESFKFNDNFNFFFWFLTDCKDEVLEEAINSLISYGGLGGKITSGKGHINCYKSVSFSFDEFQSNLNNNYFFNLGTFAPLSEERTKSIFEKSKYTLLKKGGFNAFGNSQRKDFFMFDDSSCFVHQFARHVFDVGNGRTSLKFSKPFFIRIREEEKNDLKM